MGGLWLLEIFTSLGQFVISWCAVIYYFTSKDEDNDKVHKEIIFDLFSREVDIRAVAWKGLLIALRYHAGGQSLRVHEDRLQAAYYLVPLEFGNDLKASVDLCTLRLFRIPRMIAWLWAGGLQDQQRIAILHSLVVFKPLDLI